MLRVCLCNLLNGGPDAIKDMWYRDVKWVITIMNIYIAFCTLKRM